MNWVERLFAYIGGAYIPTLKSTPSDISKYVTIGVFVFNTALLAFVTMSFALHAIFLDDPILAWPVAVVWALVIFGIDWGLVKTMKKQQDISWFRLSTYTQIILPTLLRIAVATLISFTISKPLEVKIFEGKLAAKIEEMKSDYILNQMNIRDSVVAANNTLEELDASISETANMRDTDPEVVKRQRDEADRVDAEVETLSKELDERIAERRTLWNRHKEFVCQKYDSTGVVCLKTIAICRNARWRDLYKNIVPSLEKQLEGKRGELSTARKKVQEYEDEHRSTYGDIIDRLRIQAAMQDSLEKDRKIYGQIQDSILRAEAENAYDPRYLISQIEALEELANDPNQDNSSVFWTKWLIFSVIWLLDLMPVFIKILSPFGPYEQAMLDVERDKEYESRLRNKLMREEYRNNQSMMRSLARRQKQYIMEAVKSQFNKKKEEFNKRRNEDED